MLFAKNYREFILNKGLENEVIFHSVDLHATVTEADEGVYIGRRNVTKGWMKEDDERKLYLDNAEKEAAFRPIFVGVKSDNTKAVKLAVTPVEIADIVLKKAGMDNIVKAVNETGIYDAFAVSAAKAKAEGNQILMAEPKVGD